MREQAPDEIHAAAEQQLQRELNVAAASAGFSVRLSRDPLGPHYVAATFADGRRVNLPIPDAIASCDAADASLLAREIIDEIVFHAETLRRP